MNITEIFKNVRKEKKYTQTDVANYLGIAQTSYSDIENGVAKLMVEDYLKICKFLDIDPVSLVKDTNAIIVSITPEEANSLNKLNEKIQQNFSIGNISIKTSGDVIIGQNIKK